MNFITNTVKFSISQRIRAYDYDPKKLAGRELYAEGNIVDIVTAPYLAYLIWCKRCTYSGRENNYVLIPVSRNSHEFDGRVVQIE